MADDPISTPATQPPADPAAAFQRLLERHQNDATALSRQLYEENYRYRDQIRELTTRLPADGATVLTTEQAASWQAYQQLGAVADIQTGLQASQTAQQELTALKQDLTLRDVAAAMRYDLDVLRAIGGTLTYLIKDEQVNGKPSKAIYIKDGDKETPIAQFESGAWSKFLPSLKLQPERPAIGTPHQQLQQPTQGAQPPRKPTVRL